MRNSLLIVAGLLFLTVSCTRQTKSDSLSVKVPVPQKVGGLANVYELDVAIANVQIAGRAPIVVKKEMHGPNAVSVPVGQQLMFDIPLVNPPSGANVFVQVLSVYRGSDAGDMKFYYGDANAAISGATEVTVNSQPSGTSSGKEAQISGRFLTANNSGPTGSLQTIIDVGLGKPPMIIEVRPIINGWFEAFAVQGANFDLKVLETNETLFDDLSLDASGALQRRVGGVMTPIAVNVPARLTMKKPASFGREDGQTKPTPESLLALGYFDNNSDTYVNAVSRSVLYPAANEGIPGSFTDAAMTIPQNYNTGGSGSDVLVSGGGGLVKSIPNTYTFVDAACTLALYQAGDCMIFHHAKLSGGGREGYTGMSVPFRAIKILSPREGFVTTKFKPTACAGADCIQLNWDLLPGTAAVLSELEVWSKFSSGGGGDMGGGELRCDSLSAMGFSKATGTVLPATGTFDFKDGALDSTNYNNYQFFLCAKVGTGTTARYVGRPVRADCSNCEDSMHLGWAPSGNVTVSTNIEHTFSRRIAGNFVTTNPYYTSVDVTSALGATFGAGDEIMISVMGRAGGPKCGTIEGQVVEPGRFGFARVIESQSSTVKVAKGSLLDDLAGSGVLNADLAALPSSGSFCHIQLSRVVHYNDLSLNSGFGIYSSPFSFAVTGAGGVLPIRVSGNLTMNGGSFIKSFDTGYAGGAATNFGGGTNKDANSLAASDIGGGFASTYGGGGGGYGRGGMKTGNGVAGQGNMGMGGMMRLLMGGGGGGPASAGVGSNGGGIVFLVANKMTVLGAANKVDASGGVATTGGGGGGGGSSFIFARTLTGGGSLNFSAKGGDGAASQGGAGGGGSITRLLCKNDPLSTVATGSDVGIGAGSNDDGVNPAQAGNIDAWSSVAEPYVRMCSGQN